MGRSLVRPVDQLEAAVEMLDKRGAALHPVPIVAVQDTTDLADFRVMNVAADHPVQAATAGLVSDGIGEGADELHGVLDAVLE